MLVETKIYLHWMAQQDPAIYRQFQEYGAGKAKLYARISDELPNEARTAGFRESFDEFQRLIRNPDLLDRRVVDTRDTFAAGKSIRAMADETGLLDFYRQAYSISSGVSHSEWWSVETHVMEHCLNVLHGTYLIPSLSLNAGANVELATAWVDQFYSLVRPGPKIIEVDQDAIASAFAWMNYLDDPSAMAAEMGRCLMFQTRRDLAEFRQGKYLCGAGQNDRYWACTKRSEWSSAPGQRRPSSFGSSVLVS